MAIRSVPGLVSTMPAMPVLAATRASKHSYQRRNPADSLVRQIFVQQWPALQRELVEANEGRELPEAVR